MNSLPLSSIWLFSLLETEEEARALEQCFRLRVLANTWRNYTVRRTRHLEANDIAVGIDLASDKHVVVLLSASFSFAGPGASDPVAFFWAGFTTAAGAACFLLGSYLMIPELFDEPTESQNAS